MPWAKCVNGKILLTYPINLGKKSIGKNTPDKKSIGKVTRFANAGALSSLGAKLEMANPIDKNSTPPKRDNNNIERIFSI